MPVDILFFALTLTAALGCGLMAGLFFAFSVCVMKALSRLPTAEGIRAMQSINSAIINPVFAVVFFGTALACVLLIIISLFRWHDSGAVYVLVGGALYLIGGLLITFIFNVPRNNALAALEPTSPDSATIWADYLSNWTASNHVRTVTVLLALAFLTIAIGYQIG